MTLAQFRANALVEVASGVAHVFISYKSEDRERLAPLVKALEADGSICGGTRGSKEAPLGARSSSKNWRARGVAVGLGASALSHPRGDSFAMRQAER